MQLPEEARRKKEAESDHWWDRQHSLVLRQTPRWAQGLVIALILLGGGGVIASSIIKIDEVITVTGTLKPTEGIYEVKTPAGGLVKRVLAKEGSKVEKGDLLVEFDTRSAEEEIKNIRQQIEGQKISFESTKRALNSRLDSTRKSLDTNEKILGRMAMLTEIGAVEENALLQQNDRVFQIKTEINQIDEELVQKESIFERNISDLKSRLKKNEIQKQYELVYAPRSGVVFENKAIEKGVLSGGELIMKIIPQNSLKGSVSVTNREIGFINIGQKAQVRIDSFNYTQFGYINGYVQSIGAEVKARDTESGSEYTFPVILKLEENYLENKGVKIGLQSGMSITANLKLREKRLISVVSDIFNYNNDALQRLRQ